MPGAWAVFLLQRGFSGSFLVGSRASPEGGAVPTVQSEMGFGKHQACPATPNNPES